MTKALSKGDIFNVRDRATEPVDVPEWGGRVWVRTLTSAERDEYEAGMVRVVKGKAEPNVANARARFVALVCCDEQGQRLFDDDDAGQLGDRGSPAIDRIFEAGKRLNRMNAGDVEDAKGN
jgi:hypothetical protein